MFKKQHIALLLFALVSIKTLLVPVVYLDFELRKEYIIKNLCENRFKPQLHCDGKCYLAKRLQKVAENDARNETEKQTDGFKKIIEDTFEEIDFSFTRLLSMTEPDRLYSTFQSPLSPAHLSLPIKPPIS